MVTDTLSTIILASNILHSSSKFNDALGTKCLWKQRDSLCSAKLNIKYDFHLLATFQYLIFQWCHINCNAHKLAPPCDVNLLLERAVILLICFI